MSNNINVVNTNNWYQKMNLNGTQNVTNMVLSGTNPSTQLALISVANDVHYCYSNYALQKTNGFTLTFQFYITGTNMNSICAYFGVTDPTTSFDANGGLTNQSGAVELRIAPSTPIFQLYTNYGSNTIAATSSTSVTTGSWQTVTITYTPSATGTWVVNYNGTNVISYNDTSFTSFVNNQNTLWGIYGGTSNAVTGLVRAVDLSVKQSMPMSVLKNTYSFYPEECFINKLSTHSQTNAAAAFGLRLLKADYLGAVINVRRGSDNATLDFYADSKGNVGTTLYGTGTTLLTWLAGSIGYITRWYDQSGNGRDVIQATTTTELLTNGSFAGNTNVSQLNSAGSYGSNTIITLANPGDSAYVLQQTGDAEYEMDWTTQLAANTTYTVSGWYSKSSDYNGTDSMLHMRAFSSSGNYVDKPASFIGDILETRVVGSLTWYYCSTTITTPADYTNFKWFLGYGGGVSTGYRYYTKLSITTPSVQPKIGTPILDSLSTSGKSAARGVYTLYRANSTYTGATIKLRRSSDNAVSDFYADVYGNLGTSANATGTSFSSWIGSSTAYVDTWYDQSGSGNHATQSTTNLQPVYNGTLKLLDFSNSSFLNMGTTSGGPIPTGTLNAPYTFVIRHGAPGSIPSGGSIIVAGGNTASSQLNGIGFFPNYGNYWYNNDLHNIGTPVSGNTFVAKYDGTNRTAYINNNMAITAAGSGYTASSGYQQYIGKDARGAETQFAGQLYTLFIFNTSLSDADRMACTSNPTDLNIRYDGSQFLSHGSTNYPLNSGLDTYTYICDTRIDINTSYNNIVTSGPKTSNNRSSVLVTNDGRYGFCGEANDAFVIPTCTFAKRKIVMMCNHNLNSDNITINDNGSIYTGTTGSPSSLNVGAGFYIGTVSTGVEYFTGNINEVIVFRNTLTTKESMLYFTPNAITRKDYRSQPVLQIKDVPKDNGAIPAGAVVAIDTQMLQNLSPGSPVSSWNGFTGLNSPVINAAISGTGNFLTIPGYVSLTNNNVSASLSTGQYLNAGSKTFNINTNGGFTAVWYGAFTGSATADERIFDFGNGQSSNNLIAMRYAGSTAIVFFLFNGDTGYSVQSGNDMITQNEWAVWTFRYTASSRYMEIIKNGILYSTVTAGAAITDRTLTNTWIGRSNWTGNYYSNINTAGLYVYDRFLTDAQVASVSNHLMNCTTSTMPSALPDYNNKVVRFGHVLSQGFRNGQAMYFSGKDTNSYLDIQDVPNYPLTFCFWFYNVNAYNSTNISIAGLCSADLAGNGIQLDMNTPTTLNPLYHNGSNWVAFTSQTVALNTWHHVAFTITPTTISFYLNGSLVQTLSGVVYNTNRLVIGKSGDNLRPYNGYIADIRVFDYALRADEITKIGDYTGQAGQEIMNYNTPTNYLVNMSNWYNFMNTYQTGSFTIASDLTGADVYYRLTGNGVANSSNTLFNSTKIQNYNSFTCSFLAYLETVVDHGYYFYCGATSSTTVPSGTAGTAANSSYYFYFQITGTKGIYLFNDQGQQLAYSPLPTSITNSVYVPITISYNRSTRNTWTVNVASQDVLVFNDPNNANWVSNIAGDIWGIGARTTTSGMSMYIRRVELSYTPFVNTINTTINAQNNVKFPPGAMTAATTTFTGTSILDGNYTATASNSNGAGINPYSAFDNNTSTYWGELDTSYGVYGVYTGGVSTAVTNLVNNITTSYSGEWLQIQVPNAVSLNSFSLMGRQDSSLFLWRTPSTFYVAGSNDNSTWQLIHSTSGAEFTSAMQYFTCNANNTNKYRYFRIITSRISNPAVGGANGPGGPTIDIAAWDLYTQMNTVNSAVIAVPPYSMTANTTTFAGNSVYDGTYTLTSSNTAFGGNGGDMFNAFDDTYGANANTWGPGGYYNSSSGVYTGSASTTVSGVSQSGEWVQMQLPNPIVLYSFSLKFFWTSDSFWAKSFLIAASNDNSTWTNIYDTTNGGISNYGTYTFVVTGSSVPYRYFRLIVRSTSGSPTCAIWFLDQWKLYTNQSNFNLTKFPPAPLTADTPVTFNTVNQKNWYNVMTYGVTSGGFTPVLSGSDPFKQLQLSNGSTSNVDTYCNVSQTPTNYSSFVLSFQLYATNVNSGEFFQLYFGGGGYVVQYAFGIAAFQGIRMNTSYVENPVSSATNWYNSTWNDIRIVYNRGPTNTWTMFFNETQILQYSDPNWAKVPGSTWGFQVYNTTTRFDSSIRQLEMTIAPASLPGNNILSGSYTASASSYYDNNNLPCYAFGNNIWNASNYGMWHSATGAYNNGAYTGGYTTTVSGTSYSGEWLQLQAPNPLQLASFGIYPRQDSSLFQRRSPRNFVIAGSNNGSTWDLLHTATGISDWTAAEKYFVCNGTSVANKYSYFRLITMAVGNPNPGTGDYVNIVNLNLYTPISLNNSITPATPKGLLDGLTWKYYDGASGYSVSYYTTNTYRNIGRSTNTTNINTLTSGQYPVDNGDYYSMEIFGYFRATVSGTYTFSLSSDDGSYIWIGPNALVGYTTSNANMNNQGTNALISCTVTLLSGTYYPIRIHYVEVAGGDNLIFSFTPPGGTQTYNGQGYFFSGTGLDSAFPQESAKIIKDLTNTNKDGVYYILVNGISTPVHCLMNDCYDGGGWMILMKGTTGSTFQYSANYWTSKNTLNAGDLTRNDADAKYDTFNYSTVKDVLAIWPDIPPRSYTNPYGNNGGSIFVDDGWTWMVNNWNETTRITPFTGFNTTRLPHQNSLSSFQTYGINNPSRYNGFGGWCSRQTGSYQHVFYSTGNNANVRWGFLFNNETNELNTCDVFCGIGMGGLANQSAGDFNNGGAWAPVGINRTARFEMYGR